MSRQLRGTETRARNLELGDSQPRDRGRLGSLLSTALKRVVKETRFTFAVSKELLQTAAREGTDKGRAGNVPILRGGRAVFLVGTSPFASI